MQQYPKRIKRLLREHVSRAYDAELGQELGKLEQQFVAWRKGEIAADDLKELIHEFHQGPARQIWSRYNHFRVDDELLAVAILDGLLPRDTVPAELLEAIQPVMTSIEQLRAEWSKR